MKEPTPKQTISREEIRAIYREGEDAVIALVEGLLKKIEQLEARLKVLENQAKKDSRNSSKPPSSDGFGGVYVVRVSAKVVDRLGMKVTHWNGEKR